MPDLIETRPFTIHPELFAWPSFRVYTLRTVWLYPVVAAVLAFLLWGGMSMSPVMSVLVAIGLTLAFIGLNFVRYRGFLMRPANREIYRNCVVSLTENEVRQDFTDGSHMAINLFAVTRVRDVGGFLFVFATPRLGIVAPRIAFESAAEADEFERRIRAAVRPH